ncbi:hypothetical protein GGD41_007374 [Paraburkholderia bryophila]|uniref:Uncharacterized protein n=1 Tax=Paraburkholderia bryophila TaxID=420952 RepID=A0A7Y9WH54_9BURK|nr:hypothetical protein [Paraburkholderia bryophila]
MKPAVTLRVCAPACSVKGLLQIDHRVGQRPRLRTQIQAQVVGRLVVARAAGAQLAAGRAQTLREFAFEERVHVLVVRGRRDFTREKLRRQPVHFREQPLQFFVGENLRATQLLSVRARAGQIVGREAEETRLGARQRFQRRRRSRLETAAPQTLDRFGDVHCCKSL